MTSDGLLSGMLSVAVPLWIDRIKRERWPWARIAARAGEIGPVIASRGDRLLYKSKKAGETAEVFNRLAEGVACLAFVPGGVTAFGTHYEAELPAEERSDET